MVRSLLLLSIVFYSAASQAKSLCISDYCLYYNFKSTYRYMGNLTGLVTLSNGVNLYVDTRDGVIAPYLIVFGEWETRKLKLVESFLTKDSKVIEVGANVGYYTFNIARQLHRKKGNGEVWSFEANPRLASLLKKSSIINKGKVNIFNELVYDNVGDEMSFSYFESNVGMGRVHSGFENSNMDPVHTLTMKTNTLDNVLGKDFKADLVRMDAEGSEFKILRGASYILNNSNDVVVFMEWNLPALSKNSDVSKELDYYLSKGYNFYDITKKGLTKIHSKQDLMNIEFSDIVMTRKKL